MEVIISSYCANTQYINSCSGSIKYTTDFVWCYLPDLRWTAEQGECNLSFLSVTYK